LPSIALIALSVAGFGHAGLNSVRVNDNPFSRSDEIILENDLANECGVRFSPL